MSPENEREDAADVAAAATSQRWRDDELSERSRLEAKQGHLPHFSLRFFIPPKKFSPFSIHI